ncbi:MAG: cyclic nucleotide-binding domain-containing protein [Desulfarculus sp.]|nr:cyclic nucleotide-binding domain-containing protein [Desulfarculus sp.]
MLEDLLADKTLAQSYRRAWNPGETIFNEGDASEDLYILVSGVVGVYKGQHKVAQIDQAGSVFGEMSFLLGQTRSATLRCQSAVEALCIPRDQVGGLLSNFPKAAEEMARLLARRLDTATQVVHGLKEFCDQLPDAVVLCDPQGKVTAFNAAASQVYGLASDQAQGRAAEELFHPPQAFRQLADEAQRRAGEAIAILTVANPIKGPRQIQVSLSPLRDNQHELVGLVFIGRDVTLSEGLRRRYRRLVRWTLPGVLLLMLVAAASYWDIPPFDRDQTQITAHEQLARDEVGRDCLLLQSLLEQGETPKNPDSIAKIFSGFLAQHNPSGLYRGVLLLDSANRVVAGASAHPDSFPLPPPGSIYASQSLTDNQPGAYRLLELYRTTPGQPSGVKSLELLFTLPDADNGRKWLVLLLDRQVLKKVYQIGDDQIERFRFGRL